ncbi:MAG TPA: hypothetical protein VHD61_04660 [Lacunisphaera sp.]|nr:hypothetical protein [Lacunisphaera sp.]
MRHSRSAALFSLVAAFGFAPPALASEFMAFSRTWGNAIVVTDMTPEGRALPHPSPGRPVYYRGLSLGCKLGWVPGDLIPDEKKLGQYVAKILARQGYLYAVPGQHEPSIFLVLQWGYLQPNWANLSYMTWFVGYQQQMDVAAPASVGLLGLDVLRRDFRSDEVETMLDTLKDPAYGVIVTAFDFQTAKTDHPTAYWQTRICLPAVGKTMAAALPTMIAAAGPQFGRETPMAVLRDADGAREGHVDLGELRVVGYEDPTLPPRAAKTGNK